MTTETLSETAAAAPKFSIRTVLHNAGIGLALLALIVFFSLFTEHFLTPNNITNILTQITINLVLAVGMTFRDPDRRHRSVCRIRHGLCCRRCRQGDHLARLWPG